MNPHPKPTQSRSESICLECGLCCNGVIFADVTLQADDSAQRLRALGLQLANQDLRAANARTGVLEARRPNLKLPQPCSAFDGCCCRIYSQRPQHCRQFECILLKKLKNGEIAQPAAKRIIRQARQAVERIQALLTTLGDEDSNQPLRTRFQRLSNKMQQITLPPGEAVSYGELTLAMHQLDCLLSEHFYR